MQQSNNAMDLPLLTNPFTAEDTPRAAYAKAILLKNVTKIECEHHYFGRELPKRGESNLAFRDVPIGIVGAGVTGLAVGICLAKAGYTNIEILEADPKRIGGRCYTHTFKKGPDCDHNYYDVGAMRIPKIQTMRSTFAWIKRLNKELPRIGKPLIKKKKYIFAANCEPTSYFYKPKQEDPTCFKKFMMDPKKGILTKNGFLDPQTLKPVKDFNQVFQDYLNSKDHPDRYSTRGFLMHKAKDKWSYHSAQLAEAFNTSTGLFDQAFMETICDYYDFQAAKDAKWYRIEGGMSRLTDALESVAEDFGVNIIKNAPVFSMSTEKSQDKVTVKYRNCTKRYNAVFNTTTLGALQRMDLSGLGLHRKQLIAIRALSYDRATKVAIKFSSPWWISIMPKPESKYPPYKYGGVSSSDLSISNVVYPSWNDGDQAHTLIVSYTWAQDATRIASLIAKNDAESTDVNDPLVTMIFRQLQEIWSHVPAAADVVTPHALAESYIAHHAFSWANDPNASGGYALFGPGQFKYLYTKLVSPLLCNKFIVCGEAISTHHAWISGAFDSAYNAVYAWLEGNCDWDGQDTLTKSGFGAGPGLNTEEMDPSLVAWKVALTRKLEEQA